MVMETPSPQCVALEFVRQYYTLLNKAPMHLHRFYSNDSLFMHGGPNSVTDPTVGQANIHKKIISLCFRDCHAKIRMVDAHATLGDGVVIQVTGELSNNGSPMRRFMQTFVLAPQTAKKFYVHNDIFRYQDEVFSDDDAPEECISDQEDQDLESSQTNTTESGVTGTYTPTLPGGTYPIAGAEGSYPTPVTTIGSYSNPATVNGTHGITHARRSVDVETPVSPVHTHNFSHQPSPQATTPVTPQSGGHTPNQPQQNTPPPVSSTTTSVSSNSISVEPEPSPVPEEDGWDGGPPSDSWNANTPHADEWQDALEDHEISTPKNESTPKNSPDSGVHSSPPPPTQAPRPSNEPKTYANLVKSLTSNYSSHAHSAPQHQTQSNFSSSQQSTASPNSYNTETNTFSTSTAYSNNQHQQNRNDMDNRSANNNLNASLSSLNSQPPSVPNNSSGSVNSRLSRGFYDDDKRRGNVPDNQQVFVGNLPTNVHESDLRKQFELYGRVVEVRINIGKAKSGPGSVPNFGFVAFEDDESVKKCLDNRPIYLHGTQRLNVEEKKARLGMSMGGQGGRPLSGGGRQNNMGGPPRGGPRGGSRGGFGRDNSRGGGPRNNTDRDRTGFSSRRN